MHSTVAFGHMLWQSMVKPGDLVVDATCGNGYDTLLLANLALTRELGSLIAIDIQEAAIENTKALLLEELCPLLIPHIELVQGCHSRIGEILSGRKPKLVTYNLGYLPNHDKTIKTDQATTVQSVMDALDCLADRGAVSITCYPGHQEGAIEEEKLIELTKGLSPRKWHTMFSRFINKKQAPSLLLIQKIDSNP